MCFGVTLASTGATLAIDVTPGNKRDQANLCFAWSGVLGMLIGVAVGVWYGTSFSFFTWMCVSALLGGVSVLCISMLDVCFRAPLDLPLFSLDRFLLPRVLLPGINMMIVPLFWVPCLVLNINLLFIFAWQVDSYSICYAVTAFPVYRMVVGK
jgi:hypothetical protein